MTRTKPGNRNDLRAAGNLRFGRLQSSVALNLLKWADLRFNQHVQAVLHGRQRLQGGELLRFDGDVRR